MFFDTWGDLFRILVIGIFSYVYLMILLRISGKRTLSKLNAFDLIVTVALGSTLSSVIVNKSISLTEGFLAMTLLVLLQYLVAYTTIRSKKIKSFIKAEPRLLFYEDEFRDEAMEDERIARDEVMQVVRQQGMQEMDKVAAVILETNGKISVISKSS
ncbi:DUF421 domain-containing protein [Paenibacillus wulumuqiensis]|uniref:DUF421 domain-containing protein n=1 Tax=Paenibacillus wulumuqiensis TaxID=1567107 RepID=UPI0006194586|nr:YetF domain-containing protein [Paenibacillus wulumuqiensis]